MHRKIGQHGQSSLSITLPHSWVQKYNLKKGDEIELTEANNKLTISTKNAKSLEKKDIDLRGHQPLIHRSLVALYAAGYDEIELLLPEDQIERVKRILSQEFIGMDVTNETSSSVTAKQIMLINPNEFDQMLKRLFQTIITMGNDLHKAVQDEDLETLKEIVEKDFQVNKLTDFCRRALNKYDTTTYKRTKPLYLIVEQIEKTGNLQKEIAKHIVKTKQFPSILVMDIYNIVNQKINDFYAAFYKFNLEDAEKFVTAKKDFLGEFHDNLREYPKEDMAVAFILITLYNYIHDLYGPLLLLNL